MKTKRVLVLRTPSGISGDMLVSGFAVLLGLSDDELECCVDLIGFPELANTVKIRQHTVGGVSGWQAKVSLPHNHVHRPYVDIRGSITRSKMSDRSKEIALAAFEILAIVEGSIHGIAKDEVVFHEVGALDSIADICLGAILFDRLAPDALVCSPLPVADGVVRCAHGLMMSPAPAVQEMLVGVPVYGVAPEGETVTPTALALLRALGAHFGVWPAFSPQRLVRVYGTKVFRYVPNGALFAIGSLSREESGVLLSAPILISSADAFANDLSHQGHHHE